MEANTQPIQGGKFLSDEEKKAQAREKKEAEFAQRKDKITAVAGLVLCDGLMLAMILNGLIDNVIGMLFLIGISVFFGGKIN